jgi:hypothetical protein
MKMLIPALAFAIVIVAPGLTEPADARAAARKNEPTAGKLGGDSDRFDWLILLVAGAIASVLLLAMTAYTAIAA